MRHSASRDLLAHWTERRRNGALPARADIDPVAIRNALGDVFILAADFVNEHRFRLAGTRVCALFGREMKGESFAALWDEKSRPAVKHMLEAIGRDKEGMVASVTGRTDDSDFVELEWLILPLAHQGHARVRALGVLAPIGAHYWLGSKPLTALTVGAIRSLGDKGEAKTARPPLTGQDLVQKRRNFTVHQGGLPSGRAG
jgi:hypothetical protein